MRRRALGLQVAMHPQLGPRHDLDEAREQRREHPGRRCRPHALPAGEHEERAQRRGETPTEEREAHRDADVRRQRVERESEHDGCDRERRIEGEERSAEPEHELAPAEDGGDQDASCEHERDLGQDERHRCGVEVAGPAAPDEARRERDRADERDEHREVGGRDPEIERPHPEERGETGTGEDVAAEAVRQHGE